MKILVTITCMGFLFLTAQGQQIELRQDSLKQAVLQLQNELDHVQLHLQKSQKQFKIGMIIASIGYSVTIAGGLMLGRKNDDLGKVLLVSGGVIGITGTGILIDSFRHLGVAGRDP